MQRTSDRTHAGVHSALAGEVVTSARAAPSSAPAASAAPAPSAASSAAASLSAMRDAWLSALRARWAQLDGVQVRGHAVPRWALVGGAALISTALLVAISRISKGRRGSRRILTQSNTGGKARVSRRSPTSTRKAGGAGGSSDTASRTGGAGGLEAGTGSVSYSDVDSDLLLMGDEEGLSDEERLFRRHCSRFLTQVGRAGEEDESHGIGAGGVDAALERSIRAELPVALTHYNAASRSLAAHLLLAVNALKLNRSETEEEFHALMKNQHRDMLLAWELLACSDENEWETRTLDILRIQVAQCLKDGGKMLALMDRMGSHPPESWNLEECMLLFTVAPLLGRWKDTLRFGRHLREKFPDSGVLHSMSSMDYEVLEQLAQERVSQSGSKSNAKPDQLVWCQYQIKSQRLRLIRVITSDAEMERDLRAQFTDPDTGEQSWQALATSAASEVVRCGAIAQLKSFSPAGIPLVGPADDSHMRVRGRFNMHDGRQRQVETYDLRRVKREQLQGGGAQEVAETDRAEAEARSIEEAAAADEQGQSALAASSSWAGARHRGASLEREAAAASAQDQYWKGSYEMVQESIPIDPSASGHGHSHGGGVLCGHNHGGSPSSPTAAAASLASLTVTFELELVLRPRASPTDDLEESPASAALSAHLDASWESESAMIQHPGQRTGAGEAGWELSGSLGSSLQ